VGVSDLNAIGSDAQSSIAAAQARIAQIQAMLGQASGSFSSALASATTDTTSAAADAAALGVDPSAAPALDGSAGVAGASSSGGDTAAQVIAEAKKYLGVKYVWGGESPSGFDCSGLVQYVYKKFGVNLPRVSQDQAHAGRAVSAADAKPGDLVFYHNPATHVGIYLGNGMMLDAPNSHSVVRIEKLWSGVSGFRRVLPDSAVGAASALRAASGGGSSVSALAATLPPAGKQYASAIVAAANKNGVNPALLAAVVWQESNFNSRAVSPAGAQGLVQLMPATARGLGVNALDPSQALDGGARYLKQQLNTFGGRTDLALAAYNAGPSAVRRYGGVPPYSETQNYVRTVENKMSALSAKAA
jgi:peptidoglycan DL-endopeptidase CwlO